MAFGGLWHGLGLAIEKVFSKKHAEETNNSGFMVSLLRMAFVFTFVSFGWLLFKLTDFNEAVGYLISIKENRSIPHNYNIILNVFLYSIPVIFYHLIYLARSNINRGYYFLGYDYIIYACMAILIVVNGGIPGEFVYFQF